MAESVSYRAIVDGVVVPPADELRALAGDETSARIGFAKDLFRGFEDKLRPLLPDIAPDWLGGLKWPIRSHPVADVPAYLDICRRYTATAAHGGEGWKCVFRGQWREHRSADGFISVTPMSWRSDLHTLYELDAPELHARLHPWVAVLEAMGLSGQTGLVHAWREDEQTLRFYRDGRSGGRVLTNPYLLALLMHYGFPTPSLDVTPDPAVALWFALHREVRDRVGRVRYADVSPSDVDADPVVYVYLQPNRRDHPVVELAGIPELRDIALRPGRQSATALPFRSYFAQQSIVTQGWATWEEDCHRWPSAAIKPTFTDDELRVAYPELGSAHLFPQDDPVYRELIAARVPDMRVYV